MTELQLYKACEDKEMAWRGKELIIWIKFHELEKFINDVGTEFLEDGGLMVNLRRYEIAFDLIKAFEDYVNVEAIFSDVPKED